MTIDFCFLLCFHFLNFFFGMSLYCFCNGKSNKGVSIFGIYLLLSVVGVYFKHVKRNKASWDSCGFDNIGSYHLEKYLEFPFSAIIG